MSKLQSLKITECPAAFASFAQKHNALVSLLEGIVGQNGISVVLSEKNGVIRGSPVTASVTEIHYDDGGGFTYDLDSFGVRYNESGDRFADLNLDEIRVGSLALAARTVLGHGTAAVMDTATGKSITLDALTTPLTKDITLDETGVVVEKGSDSGWLDELGLEVSDGTETTEITKSAITVDDGTNSTVIESDSVVVNIGSNSVTINSTGLTVAAGANSLDLAFADITHSMSIREIDVCVSNVPMQMLVVASAPY